MTSPMLGMMASMMGNGPGQVDIACAYCAATTATARGPAEHAELRAAERPGASVVAGTLVCRGHVALALDDAR